MGCTVKELLNRVNSEELSEWMAFNKIEPFGYERDDMRFAILTCVIANCNRSSKQRPFKISDFMLKFDRLDKPREQTDEEIEATLMQLVKK